MSGMTQTTSGPEHLLEELFGPVLDVELVLKSMPDQADLHVNRTDARRAKVRRNVERGSNAVGIAAGTLGLAAAARDDRLATGGKVARAIHATGHKAPSFVGRVKSPKAQAALATGAALTQVANLSGDALIAGTLSRQPKRRRQEMAKRSVPLHPEIKNLARKVVQFWKPVTVPPVPPAAAAATQTRAGVKEANKTAAKVTQRRTDARRAGAVGTDVARMASTKSGKIATGTLAVTGANKATGGRNAGYEYVPDTYAYGKADDGIEFRGEFTKFDDAKRQAFGWASVVTKDGSPVLDRQGDYISIDDLETAAYTYVHKSRVGGDMHKRNGDAPHHVSDMIESIVFTPEKIAALNLPEGFPEGWWVGYQIHDEDTWQEVRKRGRTGFSIHGRGIRKDVDIDELMGVLR